MNKIAKILSAVLSVTLVIGVTVAMLVSAFAASAPKFSVNVVSESKDEVKIAFTLVDGSFSAIDFQVNASDWNNSTKSTGLTLKSIERAQAYKDFYDKHANDSIPPMLTTNFKNGKVGYVSLAPYDAKGDMVIFTFEKTKSAKEKIVASDIVVTVSSCTADNKEVTASVTNKIPAEVVTKPTTKPTTKPSTEPSTQPTTQPTTKPTTQPTTKPTTQPSTEPSTQPSTEPSTQPSTEPSTQPSTQPSTEPSTQPSTQPTSKADDTTKSDDVVTTAPAADTTTAASSSDVVNPETGDRLTATAAVVSLLAISGAAVVALRKKED